MRQTVTYELGRDERGRLQARQVRRASVPTASRPRASGAILGASAYLLLVAGLAAAGRAPRIAQRAFRHKTRKRSFQVAFWSAVAVNVAAFVWLIFTGGTLPI